MAKRNFTKVFVSLFSIVAVLAIVGANMCADAIKSGGIAACKFEPTESTSVGVSELEVRDYKDVEYSDIMNINTDKVNKENAVGDSDVSDVAINFVTDNDVDETIAHENVSDEEISDKTILDETTPVQDMPVVENTKLDESFASETEVKNDAVQDDVISNEPLKLTGGYASIDRSAYTDDESALLDIILGKIKGYQTNPSVREEKIPLNGLFDYESYCKISSYFYVYYGQKRAVDETFDLVNATREDGYLRLRYNDIEVFETERQANQAKIDAILSSFTSGSEEHVLKQIAEYLTKNISYTDGYYDLSSALSGRSVCNGYALAFNAMANRAGIKSDMCIGKAGGAYHAWNRVTLSDGSYRFYDVTFYDSNGQSKYLHSTTSFHGEYLINDYTSCWFQK